MSAPLRVLILLVATAASAFLAGFTAHAQAANAQQRTDETRQWMQSVLRAEVPPRHVEVGTAPRNAGEALPDGTVRLNEWATDETPSAAWVRIHELAHRPANAACWGYIADDGTMTPDRRTEEGIADALTRDLMPAAVRRFAPGWSWFVEVGGYGPEVASVRYAVRKLTGGPGWGRPERLMLRRLWAADCETRRAMLEAAGR